MKKNLLNTFNFYYDLSRTVMNVWRATTGRDLTPLSLAKLRPVVFIK